MQHTLTIPRKLAVRDDLVMLPRREYEALIQLQKRKSFNPTAAQKRALARAERNFQNGRTLSYDELAAKLESTH